MVLVRRRDGRAPGTGYVVRGQAVPDDETEVTQDEQSGPMTRFRKVASVLRGDRPDQTTPDPADAMSRPGSGEEYAHADLPDDVTAVRSPNTGNGDYWDDEQDPDATIPDATPASGTGSDPSMTGSMTGRDTYGTATPAASTASAPAYGDGADTEAATDETASAARHATAEDAGLRPGEATDRLGDFGDISFGNLLPDAEQYRAQWQQTSSGSSTIRKPR